MDSLTNIASVLPGEHVACALSEAHDWDRWQNGDIAGTANFAWVEDSPLTYSWTATRGSFLVGEGENAQLQDHADTREAVWVAPADGSGGLAVLTCVVDDAAGDRIGDPLTEVGSRNDDALRWFVNDPPAVRDLQDSAGKKTTPNPTKPLLFMLNIWYPRSAGWSGVSSAFEPAADADHNKDVYMVVQDVTVVDGKRFVRGKGK